MKTTFACMFGILLLFAVPSEVQAQSSFSPPIRIPTPMSARCINSQTDAVSVTLYRVITERKDGFFTSDNKAGVAVVATLSAHGGQAATTPSVNEVDIKSAHKGQVSLPLEYPVADGLVLHQGSTVTRNLQIQIYMAKTRGRNGFGEVLDIAGQALAKLSIPPNPYTTGAGQFLQFANQAIDGEINGSNKAQLFASLTLNFANFNEPSVDSCMADGYQPTGAIAVFTDKGEAGAALLPTSDLDKHYCFRYSSQYTYELQYAAKSADDCKSVANSAWSEVPNDYVLLLVSAHRQNTNSAASHDYLDYMMTSERLGKPGHPVGILRYAEKMQLSPFETQRLVDLDESLKLCMAMKLPARDCGVR